MKRSAAIYLTRYRRPFSIILVLSACRPAPSSKPPENAGRSSREADATPAAVVAGPGGTYQVLLPSRWSGHYRVDSLSTGERGRALSGALVFEYLPSDTTIRPQALLALAVYDSAVWRAVRAEVGPPPGDSVAAHGGRIYVIGLPQSNPFAPKSVDAQVFQVLQLRATELSGLIRFR